MSAPQFDPVQEKAELSRVIGALLHSWGKPDMAQAVATLRAALTQAEHALATLEREPGRDTAFAVHVLRLGFQVTYAREELGQAEQFACGTPAHRQAREETPDALDTVLLAGTIVACPGCGEGLYKTTTRVTTADLVLDDGTLLTPLSRTIPLRNPWTPGPAEIHVFLGHRDKKS